MNLTVWIICALVSSHDGGTVGLQWFLDIELLADCELPSLGSVAANSTNSSASWTWKQLHLTRNQCEQHGLAVQGPSNGDMQHVYHQSWWNQWNVTVDWAIIIPYIFLLEVLSIPKNLYCQSWWSHSNVTVDWPIINTKYFAVQDAEHVCQLPMFVQPAYQYSFCLYFLIFFGLGFLHFHDQD